MSKNPGFRGWYYFRNGWSLYFAFIFAATNTLTVTYYLAIERAPILKEIFPSFISYVAIVILVGVPLLVLIGYMHYKRTAAYRSEVSVNFESNPFQRRILINSEINLKLNIKLLDLIHKLSKETKNQNITSETETLIKEIEEFISERKFKNNKDLDYLKDLYNK